MSTPHNVCVAHRFVCGKSTLQDPSLIFYYRYIATVEAKGAKDLLRYICDTKFDPSYFALIV